MRPTVPGLLLLLGGCAYYNGMYNARKFAHQAERAEADGRTLEASTLWGQVALKAESVVVQHGGSKWADEARLLRGRALERLGDCNGALRPLEEAVASINRPDVVEDAAFLLGRCRERLGDAEGASQAFSRLLASRDPARRQEALFRHGRALRISGDYRSALVDLEASGDPRGLGEQAAAFAGLGQVDEALRLADSLLAQGDTAAPWDSLFAGMGRHDVERASGLVDQAMTLQGPSPATRARWLAADGRRLAATSVERASRRLDQADSAGEGSEPGLQARLASIRLALVEAREPAALDLVADRLEALSRVGGPISAAAYQLSIPVRGVRVATDSAAPGVDQGDLRLFLAAEIARDTLEAPHLAGSLFDRLIGEWPASPYAPKALLAAAQLHPESAESLRAELVTRYPDSPYLAVMRGENSSRYTELEDSLRVFAGANRFDPGRPARNRPKPKPGAATREPVDNQ